MSTLPKVYLARHGETTWSLSGQHTGRTDIPLTPRGEQNARQLGQRLQGQRFALALSSPLQRARRTCELAGFGGQMVLEPDLMEWDYGELEGKKTAEVLESHPGWFLFRDGCPGGESVAQIGARADRVVARLRSASGDVLVFAHGHILRILAARWLGLPPGTAQFFLLSTASLSILGYEHNDRDEPALCLWNDDHHVHP
jgi:broad specificity phosphatase PhoE